MAARNATLKKQVKGLYYAYAVYEVEMSQNDTTTLGEFSSAVNISQAFLVDVSDGSEVTCSKALNVVTMTGAGTNSRLVLFAFGVKA